MKIVNRGYVIVKPLKPFIDWANSVDEDYTDLTDNEASVYLIEDDFYDDEQMLKANFKKIFNNELLAITDDESLYPAIKMENFNQFFSCSLGSNVFDSMSSTIASN